MNQKIVGISIVSILIFGTAIFSVVAAPAVEEPPFDLKARLINNETAISYTLTNKGMNVVRVGIMSCSRMDNWSVDANIGKLLWPGFRGCDKNVCTTHEIKPNKSLKGTLTVELYVAAGKRMPFRLHLKTCSNSSESYRDIGVRTFTSNTIH